MIIVWFAAVELSSAAAEFDATELLVIPSKGIAGQVTHSTSLIYDNFCIFGVSMLDCVKPIPYITTGGTGKESWSPSSVFIQAIS